MSRASRIDVRVGEQEKNRWIEAALRDGFHTYGAPNLSSWLRHLANHAVEHPPPKKR